MTSRELALLLALAAPVIGLPSDANGQCVARRAGTITGIEYLYVFAGSTPLPIPPGGFSGAAYVWNYGCPSHPGIPFIRTTNPGSSYIPVIVKRLENAPTNSACGVRTLFGTNWLGTHTVTVYDKLANGTQCPSFDKVLAHELGHVMTLLESSCSGYVMTGDLSPTWSVPQWGECQGVDDGFYTAQDLLYDPCVLNPFGPGCATCFYEPSLPQCGDDCDLNPWGPNCPYSPILLDADGNGFKLTGPNPPIFFDLDADGLEDQTSWTRMQSRDPFVGLDRDGSGCIEDGSELFGTATQLHGGRLARHGYEALEEFDNVKHGGNGDGRIDPGDVVFNSLLLWFDRDRNGVCNASEVESAAKTIEWISLDYFREETTDQWGNVFRWWSEIETLDRKGRWSTDVFFKKLDQ